MNKNIIKILAVAFLFLSFALAHSANAATADNVYGQAWSSNIGFINFNNCTDPLNAGTCTGTSYGVKIDSFNNISGQAWSNNIGWVSFSGLSSCPTLPCTATYNPASGAVSGWARACSGTQGGNCSSMTSRNDGWDGWISLSSSSGVAYGAKIDVASGVGSGQAWGSDVVGWLDFSTVRRIPSVIGVCATPPNGGAYATAPTPSCSSGTPSAISGTGPWTWTCNGSGGGANASCSANPIVINGICAIPPHNTAYYAVQSPACSAGTVQSFSLFNWTWTCAGSGGGSNAFCQQLKKTDGVCQTPPNGGTYATAPTPSCTVGTPSGISGAGPWTWTCNGTNGGTNASCSANKTASGPTIDLKFDGSNAPITATYNLNHTLSWTPSAGYVANCTLSASPSNGYSDFYGPQTQTGSIFSGPLISPTSSLPLDPITFTINCTATTSPFATATDSVLVNTRAPGFCSTPPNGGAYASAPAGPLCAFGNPTPSSLSGAGPWSWSCSGSNGGASTACSANIASAVNGVCATPPNGGTYTTAPTGSLCSTGTASPSTLSDPGPWTWTCSGSGGGSNASCSAGAKKNPRWWEF